MWGMRGRRGQTKRSGGAAVASKTRKGFFGFLPNRARARPRLSAQPSPRRRSGCTPSLRKERKRFPGEYERERERERERARRESLLRRIRLQHVSHMWHEWTKTRYRLFSLPPESRTRADRQIPKPEQNQLSEYRLTVIVHIMRYVLTRNYARASLYLWNCSNILDAARLPCHAMEGGPSSFPSSPLHVWCA